jgi:DNA invertase Pin-like site-specific DNA recombinase
MASMTPALRDAIIRLYRGGAPRRTIARITGATHWQVSKVLNDLIQQERSDSPRIAAKHDPQSGPMA